MKESHEESKAQSNFLQVVENEYVTTVCLPWWDEEEDYMKYKLTKIIRKTFLNTIFYKNPHYQRF